MMEKASNTYSGGMQISSQHKAKKIRETHQSSENFLVLYLFLLLFFPFARAV